MFENTKMMEFFSEYLSNLSNKELIRLAQNLYSPCPLVPIPGWFVGQQEPGVQSPRYPLKLLWEELCSRQKATSLSFKTNWYQGLKLRFYPKNELSRCLFVEGCFEPNEMHCLTRIIKAGMTVIDAGANLGIYSLLTARLVGPKGKVIAIEPSSREYQRLKQHIKINKLKQVKPVCVALTDKTSSQGVLSIAGVGSEGHNTLGSFAYSSTKLDHKEKVKLEILDKLVKKEKLKRVDLIKLDIEGAEAAALEGSKQTVKQYQPLILVEVFDQALAGQDYSIKDLLKIFSDFNYQLYQFHQQSGLPVKLKKFSGQSENILALPKKSSWLKKISSFSEKKPFYLPLVSIVTPSYNSGRYLKQSIESVFVQNYPRIEHIIQDGGSTDKTREILEHYQQSQYRHKIKIFIEKDKGQSDALNKAIQKSKGDIILVLNADDMLMPYAVSWGVEQMRKYPKPGVIYGDAYIIDENDKITNIYQAHEYDFEKLLCVEFVPPAQASFIRRTALKAVGLGADSTLDTCPDYEMWLRLVQKFPMKHVFGVITKYRDHHSPQPDSKKTRTSLRFIQAKKEVMDRLFNSEKTPKKIKKLRRRAYIGLYTWGSEEALHLKEYPLAAEYMLKAFWLSPNWFSFRRIISILKSSPLFFLRALYLKFKQK